MPEISEELFAAFEATTFSDDEESTGPAIAELSEDSDLAMEIGPDDGSNSANAENQKSDDDETLISDDEQADACGYESERSENEEPTAEDMEFIDNRETVNTIASHQAFLQNALAKDEEEEDDDILSE